MMSASLSDAPPASEVMTAGHRLYGKTFGIFAGRSGKRVRGTTSISGIDGSSGHTSKCGRSMRV